MIYSINSFVGGMNNWIAPELLNENSSSLLVNGDVSTGKIVPLKGLKLLPNNNPKHFEHYGSCDRSVVKWYERTYWSDNSALGTSCYGGNIENFLGVSYPIYHGTLKNLYVSKQYSPTGFSGVYKYCICFVTFNGWESAPGSSTDYELSVTMNKEKPTLRVSWSQVEVDYVKVYRTIDHGAEFYCVAEIHNNGGTFVDDVSDEILQTNNPLDTLENYPPPDNGKYLCENNGVFYLAKDSLLYFSKLGNPHSWPVTNFLSFDDKITGIVPEFQGVLVFTRGKIYRVVGAEIPETIAKIYIPGNNGCIDYRTIAILNNAPIWLSSDGICAWDGSKVIILNYQKFKIPDTAVNYALAVKDKYYLFMKNNTVVYDLRNGGIFYTLDFTCSYAWYDVKHDKIYLQNNDKLYLFGEGENLTIDYKTPEIGGSKNQYKKFREFMLSAKGTSQVIINLDGKYWSKVNVNEGRERVKLPRNTLGRTLSLQIKNNQLIEELAVIYD